MIRIEVEDYCQRCPEFDPEAENSSVLTYINNKPLKVLGDNVVRCKHRDSCRNIKRYLEQYLKSSKEVTE